MRATRRPVSIAAIMAIAGAAAACGDHAYAALDEGPAGDGLEAAVRTAAGTSGSQADPDGRTSTGYTPLMSAALGAAKGVSSVADRLPCRRAFECPIRSVCHCLSEDHHV